MFDYYIIFIGLYKIEDSTMLATVSWFSACWLIPKSMLWIIGEWYVYPFPEFVLKAQWKFVSELSLKHIFTHSMIWACRI